MGIIDEAEVWGEFTGRTPTEALVSRMPKRVGQATIAGIEEEINCLASRVQGLEAKVRRLEARLKEYEPYDEANPCASF